MRELTLKEIQEVSLGIYLEFSQICTKNGYKHWMIFGTLIGAVRNQGFIPWDDDLDVMMPREDFNDLINFFNKEYDGALKLCMRSNTKDYYYGIPRLVNPNYTYFSTNEKEKHIDLGAFIDIYPLDNYCNDIVKARRMDNRINRWNNLFRYMINPYLSDSSWKFPLEFIIGKVLRLAKGKDYNKYIDNEIVSYIENHTSSQDGYVGLLAWSANLERGRWRKEWFNSTIDVEFEHVKVPIPIGYDELLTKNYGDYMTIPPENERLPHHEYKIFNSD